MGVPLKKIVEIVFNPYPPIIERVCEYFDDYRG